MQYFPQCLLLHGLIEPFLVEVDVDILKQLCATLLKGMKKLHIICWSSNACTQRDHILHHLHGDVGHGAETLILALTVGFLGGINLVLLEQLPEHLDLVQEGLHLAEHRKDGSNVGHLDRQLHHRLNVLLDFV